MLALLGTLAILVSCATSLVMWRKRKPRGLGAPPRVPGRRALTGLAAITVTLGLVFPLVGISLGALLVFELVIVRRVRWGARGLT